MRVLIGDDEPLARQRLIRLLGDVPECSQVEEAGSGDEVLRKVRESQPDVVLLDIRMPGMDGLETAKRLQDYDPAPVVIFCTAYDEHALEAFRVHAVDYLLKPVGHDALVAALARVKQTAGQSRSPATSGGKRQFISAHTHKGLELIALAEVRYFLADQKYVTVRHGQGEVLVDDTLKDLENEFGNDFVRIHRNALIAKKYLEGLEMTGIGQYQVRLGGIAERLIVSRRHVAGLRKLMQTL